MKLNLGLIIWKDSRVCFPSVLFIHLNCSRRRKRNVEPCAALAYLAPAWLLQNNKNQLSSSRLLSCNCRRPKRLKAGYFLYLFGREPPRWKVEQPDGSSSGGRTWPELLSVLSLGRWHRVGVLASDPADIPALIRGYLVSRWNFPAGHCPTTNL